MNNQVPVTIITGYLCFYLNNVVTVVDVSRIYKEFLADMDSECDKENDNVINLIIDQIEFCSLLVLNKCDLIESEQLAKVRNVIRGLQSEAKMIECVNGKVDAEMIFINIKFDFNKVLSSSTYQKSLEREKANNANGINDFGISSFVYSERCPFSFDRFNEIMNFDKEAIVSRLNSCLESDEKRLRKCR